jgi:hypothetical protein
MPPNFTKHNTSEEPNCVMPPFSWPTGWASKEHLVLDVCACFQKFQEMDGPTPLPPKPYGVRHSQHDPVSALASLFPWPTGPGVSAIPHCFLSYFIPTQCVYWHTDLFLWICDFSQEVPSIFSVFFLFWSSMTVITARFYNFFWAFSVEKWQGECARAIK